MMEKHLLRAKGRQLPGARSLQVLLLAILHQRVKPQVTQHVKAEHPLFYCVLSDKYAICLKFAKDNRSCYHALSQVDRKMSS